MIVFFFKQKTAYEMRISDWSSDVCSSDLATAKPCPGTVAVIAHNRLDDHAGDRCHQPEQREVLYIGTERLEDAGGITCLQGKAELDAQKAEAHIEDLCGAEPLFCSFGVGFHWRIMDWLQYY